MAQVVQFVICRLSAHLFHIRTNRGHASKPAWAYSQEKEKSTAASALITKKKKKKSVTLTLSITREFFSSLLLLTLLSLLIFVHSLIQH